MTRRLGRLVVLAGVAALYAALLLRGGPSAFSREHLDPMTPELRAAERALGEGRLDEARALTAVLIERAPQDPFIHWIRALVFQRQERWTEAAAAWDQYLTHTSAPRFACPDAAVAHERSGDGIRALALYQDCVESAPTHPEPWIDLADALARHGRFADARAAYVRARELDSENPVIRRRLSALDVASEALPPRPSDARN
ncbi:MAG: tetratricopeptide repeat protein [Vicinamibacterales bacterium]